MDYEEVLTETFATWMANRYLGTSCAAYDKDCNIALVSSTVPPEVVAYTAEEGKKCFVRKDIVKSLSFLAVTEEQFTEFIRSVNDSCVTVSTGIENEVGVTPKDNTTDIYAYEYVNLPYGEESYHLIRRDKLEEAVVNGVVECNHFGKLDECKSRIHCLDCDNNTVLRPRNGVHRTSVC